MHSRRRLRQFLIAVVSSLLMPAGIAAQVNSDVQITALGPIRDVVRNAVWATGSGNIGNNYIFTPTWTSEGVCLNISNTSSSTVGYGLQFFGTSDQSVKAYQGNQGKWTLLGPTAGIPLNGNALLGLAAGASLNYYAQVSGQARVAIVLTIGSGDAGTGTITMVEEQGGGGCGNITAGPVACPISAHIELAPAQTIQILAPVTGQAPYLCNLSFGSDQAPDAERNTIVVQNGTGATCSGGGGGLPYVNWQMALGPNAGETTFAEAIFAFVGAPLVGRYTATGFDLAGTGMCITNNSAVMTFEVNYTAAQF